MNLSIHFTFEEAIFSSTAVRKGIDNNPLDLVLGNMKQVAISMETVRSLLGGKAIHVDSWFRCEELNECVGGAKNSAHMNGFAVDFICPEFGTPLEICKFLAESGIKFDQIIQEGTWVHISFAPTLRQELLTAHFDPSGKAVYTVGIEQGAKA